MRFGRLLAIPSLLLVPALVLAQNNPLTSILRSVTSAVAPAAPAEPAKPGGNQATAVIGVRGLDEVALKNAQPAHDAVKEMDKYAASADEASAAAKQHGLLQRAVKYAGP